MFEQDITFNHGSWANAIQSQGDLFEPSVLIKISDQLRTEFHHGHPPKRQMPLIPREDWNTRLLDPYAEKTLGYGLPCLISADRPSRGRIMLCAQDPLRAGNRPELTVGTFFGIDSEYHRNRRHWGMMWQFIRQCVLAGYDMWVTDAVKIFAGKNVLTKDSQLRDLCLSVMRKECQAFKPDKILAFGGVARDMLGQADLSFPVIAVPHPTARGQRGPFMQRIPFYNQALFNSDLPT